MSLLARGGSDGAAAGAAAAPNGSDTDRCWSGVWGGATGDDTAGVAAAGEAGAAGAGEDMNAKPLPVDDAEVARANVAGLDTAAALGAADADGGAADGMRMWAAWSCSTLGRRAILRLRAWMAAALELGRKTWGLLSAVTWDMKPNPLASAWGHSVCTKTLPVVSDE
mgnify:CR=1 FL=1